MRFFLSCDWGTSNFRLRLVSLPAMKVLGEEISDNGVANVFTDWEKQSQKGDKERLAFYIKILDQHIKQLEDKLNRPLTDILVVISGMASSTIGMKELPYRILPFNVNGSDLNSEFITSNDDFQHDILLISGVKSDDDVMRGEETQLVGCMSDKTSGDHIFIHPGTHSKHITIKDGKVTAFNTFMTGEFFKLLSTNSILRNSVEKGNMSETFATGVNDSINENLLHAAFKIRTNDILKSMNKQDNYNYLSGLLIGNELRELIDCNSKIYLCAGDSHLDFYRNAFDVLGLKNSVIFSVETEENSVISGQYTIYKTLKESNHE